MRTREQHLIFCKERALAYVAIGDLQNAVVSMGTDLYGHDETKNLGPHLMMVGMVEAVSGNADAVKRWIEGFQ